MGDISAEPSMEDILSSIKRIIAEEAEPARPRRAIGSARPVPATNRQPAAIFADARDEDEDEDEVLELSDPLTPDEPAPAPTPAPSPAPTPAAREAPPSVPPRPAPEPAKVSTATVEAARGALDTLSRMVVKPEQPGSDTLEGLVRELLKPMLAQWLDQHLPAIVEQMVAREIARISNLDQ